MANTTTVLFEGDKAAAVALKGVALNQLNILRNAMSFQGLLQDKRILTYEDGTVIHCESAFGKDTVIVYVPEVIIEKEVIVEAYGERAGQCSVFLVFDGYSFIISLPSGSIQEINLPDDGIVCRDSKEFIYGSKSYLIAKDDYGTGDTVILVKNLENEIPKYTVVCSVPNGERPLVQGQYIVFPSTHVYDLEEEELKETIPEEYVQTVAGYTAYNYSPTENIIHKCPVNVVISDVVTDSHGTVSTHYKKVLDCSQLDTVLGISKVRHIGNYTYESKYVRDDIPHQIGGILEECDPWPEPNGVCQTYVQINEGWPSHWGPTYTGGCSKKEHNLFNQLSFTHMISGSFWYKGYSGGRSSFSSVTHTGYGEVNFYQHSRQVNNGATIAVEYPNVFSELIIKEEDSITDNNVAESYHSTYDEPTGESSIEYDTGFTSITGRIDCAAGGTLEVFGQSPVYSKKLLDIEDILNQPLEQSSLPAYRKLVFCDGVLVVDVPGEIPQSSLIGITIDCGSVGLFGYVNGDDASVWELWTLTADGIATNVTNHIKNQLTECTGEFGTILPIMYMYGRIILLS